MKDILRVAAIVPKVHVGNIKKNVKEIISAIDTCRSATNDSVDIMVTPELSLTGYTCQDMFMNEALLNELDPKKLFDGYIGSICNKLGNKAILLGAPLQLDRGLYNCAIMLCGDGVLGVTAKTYIPNYGEFYEKRWFESAERMVFDNIQMNNEQSISVGNKLIYDMFGTKVGVEICEDLWAPNPPSTDMALNGAEIILNCSASNEVVGKKAYRRNLVKQQSARCICGYVYCSAGMTESTSDVVFGGHTLIAENGTILNEDDELSLNTKIDVADIDTSRIRHDRRVNKTFFMSNGSAEYSKIDTPLLGDDKKLEYRDIDMLPFVPKKNIEERCREIFGIQVAGLAARWLSTGSEYVVLGLSGGLDSTLALLVAVGAARKLSNETHFYKDESHVYCITMPCFGTTSETKQNAIALAEAFGCTLEEIDISGSVRCHMVDIGLKEDDRSVAYENAQARERTQVLMDMGNKVKGFVLGTGDLSESALGWCTYNGDHMSMYSVNNSIPKTLVRVMVENIGYELMGDNKEGRDVIKAILDTPISPELLPPNANGGIAQLTEDSVGPYILNDFFMYYTLRWGMSPTRIYELTKLAVEQSSGEYKYTSEDIKKWLIKFYERFARAQFKRNCCPDGVKVGTVSLNPRGDWRMPSEFDISSWIEEVKELD